MSFSFVVAMGGVDFENVAVAGFEKAEDAGLVDYTGTTVVSDLTYFWGIITTFGKTDKVFPNA